MGKKYWLYVRGEGTGRTIAIIYTLIESAKRHGHKPYSHVRDVLERLSAMKSSEIDLLLPWNWKPAVEPAILPQMA
ncbi:transposase domain-containing protein [Luteolibacter sp. SL250]|uniref:transposase domain-containing protein n=1 Tax=Luteolibacter sp. SL250 TaxID=2995170 RepID=UPI00226F0782|nr:transposase domain-containing protein [Luteolibacter sp. SL250]WAC19078.1 transposase domain-containing protein [Luteolibacter sp. SL250]